MRFCGILARFRKSVVCLIILNRSTILSVSCIRMSENNCDAKSSLDEKRYWVGLLFESSQIEISTCRTAWIMFTRLFLVSSKSLTRFCQSAPCSYQTSNFALSANMVWKLSIIFLFEPSRFKGNLTLFGTN